ncbi:MAG: zf-HC2 domain-containing protein [Candidatus Solibacter sp.]
MSKLDLRHPEQGTLLLYVDGELPGRKARQVKSHLDACWQCRAEVEDLQGIITECVKYRKDVLAPLMPFPPAEWGSLNFELVEAELASQSLVVRLARLFSPRQSGMRWALSGALAVALCFVLVWQLHETPRVEAAALLQRAVSAAVKSSATRPNHKRLRITSRTGQVTRVLGAAYKPKPQEVEFARLFEAAHYDWNDPLSAQSYTAWRGQLAHFEDAVASQPNSYDIKTTTQESELVSATLKLRSTDLEPLEGRFEFRNHDWVELTELVDQQTYPASTVAGTTGGMPRQPGVPPGPLTASPETPATPDFSEELQVVSVLHSMGADLGDDLEITRDGSEVLVAGTGIPPQRQQQLHAALDRLPHVVVRFNESVFPASATPAPSEPATRDAAGTEKSTQAARIEERLGGRPQFERFSSSVLDWTDLAMTRAYALRRLAQQFPLEAENQMSADDRRTLRKLAHEHLAAFQKEAHRIANTVNPVLSGMGVSAARSDSQPEPATWQAASEDLLSSASRAEKSIAVTLGMASMDSAQTNSSAQLLTALAQQTARAEQCRRLLDK